MWRGYRVGRPTIKELVPPGWTYVLVVDATGRKDEIIVGPWWALWPFRVRHWYWTRFMPWLVEWGRERGLLSIPDGGYYHEIEWFPDQPRFR